MPVILRSRLRRTRVRRSAIALLAQRILDAAGEGQAELSLEFVGDHRMRRLNRRYRRRDRPTDVLAFSMREGTGPPTPLLGDVVISLPTAARQARRDGRSLDTEVATLLVHGVLHLCGYDHERGEREARRMRRKERAILRVLGRLPHLVVKRPVVGSQLSARHPKLKADC